MPYSINKRRSVIGLWLTGKDYLDLVHIWGVARAGFVPQLVSLRMTDPSVTYELLHRANAVALIHDPGFGSFIVNSPLPVWPAEDVLSLDHADLPLPDLWTPSHAEEVAAIYHTSGSTSGIPKLVPITAKWLDHSIGKMPHFLREGRAAQKQDIIVSAGSFCHIASNLLFTELVRRGGCLIIPTEIPYGAAELRQLVDQYGLTCLNTFSSFLSRFIQQARRDPELLDALQRLDHVVHSGLPLDASDEAWARERDVNLINVFACTEAGVMLQSHGGNGEDAKALQPFPGCSYEFAPLSGSSEPSEALLELVVTPESGDCPVPELRNPTDGKFHTWDLFIQVTPGMYVARGHNDDWIKMESAMRCDTGSIERNAMESCGNDLISAAVVAGAGRPSPTLIVEPRDDAAIGSEVKILSLKDEILQRILPFHKRRYVHERIDGTRFILVVPRGSMPRTAAKGNIQRSKVEERFKDELDGIFA
ncbi:hypothetical protein EDB81DRAFT_845602 [Dactylonectria macrodidyma]|uniref:AMP-dependent synthetase/ligase domain-containing protein n=1 Tax=Dactylonectria macrodidyma TaxID=307937 RepID=A0A9P9ITY2_9HYPO|nr:hypothetical protein EDB81DRAFT_845602 [Dactylonectria macrodidyma]